MKQNSEIICGFRVKVIPQKPDFLPVSQEEFVQRTLQAWTSGDKDSRISAVFLGGEREWEALWNDEGYTVRGAVAYHANEKYQLKMRNDPFPEVRKLLAIYGTDNVRRALLDSGESNREVLTNIAKFGSTDVRHRLVDAAWNDPKTLYEIVHYLPARALEKLLTHPNMEARIDAATHGSMDQCRRVLAMPYSRHDITVVLMRDLLVERIEELDIVASVINFGKTKTRRNLEMELST